MKHASPRRYALSVSVLLGTWFVVLTALAVDFRDASYSIPTEPYRAVLYVTTTASNGHVKSLTLYGDGSLDLMDSDRGSSAYTIKRKDLERLVDEAVSHGLMELDRRATLSMERLLARQGDSHGPPDRVQVDLLFGVDNYRRNGHRGRRPSRGIHIENLPAYPADYPGVLELEGLSRVLAWMDRMFQRAAPSGGGPDEYAAARFRVPFEADRLVLRLRQSSMDHRRRTLRLFGDGRLELEDGHQAEYVRYLDDTELQAVMSIAIQHGLVEYDELTMVAKKWMRFQRRLPPPVADSGHVHVVVSVNDYEHAGFEAEQAESELSLPDLYGDTRYFPEIPQFRGVAA